MGILFYMLNKYVNEPYKTAQLEGVSLDDAEAQYQRFDGSGAVRKQDSAYVNVRDENDLMYGMENRDENLL